MQRQPDIKWTKNQQQKLSKNVAKFNAKLTRLQKTNPEIAEYLPERLKVSEQKEKIKTAKDLKFLENSINRFFKPNTIQPIESDTGIKTTKWEIKEVTLEVKRINREKQKELEEATPSTEKGTMGTIKKNNLRPKNFDINKIKKSDWDKFKESAKKQSAASYKQEKQDTYKEMYLQSVKDNLGEAGKKLYDYVNKLDAEFIYKNYYNDPVLEIQFTSDPLPAKDIADASLEHWKIAMEEVAEAAEIL